MVEVWVLVLVVVPYVYMGTGQPAAALRVQLPQLPQQEQCEAVRSFLIDLDRLVSDKLHVGECARVLKEDAPSSPAPRSRG